ncbi:collagenase [Streptomyces fildesensis]|uniref:collagenase n=1 Tax=Streptomyces fildesensis TaxID=375757 RepID=UPI0027DC244A|nr:collagenase [Streptomyces fildesensis]
MTAVTADSSIADTLNTFTLNHRDLLGGRNDMLDWNAGNVMARLLMIPALQAKIRPLAKGLLDASSITGPTANLWVHVAFRTAVADTAAQCSYYGTCNLKARLTAVSLPISYPCSNFTIMAESLTATEQTDVCTSLKNQLPYYHALVKDNGPIPGQHFAVKMVIYGSKTDYSTYSWAIFGNDTNNGGETLTGTPTDPNNIAYSILYQKPSDNGFTAHAWNLNHEYTHVLQSIYDMKGTFTQEIAVPDIWWIEGQAEYVSYGYRGVTDTGAVTAAAKHTYALSTLFQSTYGNSDQTRVYPWGYLAVRYMLEKHPTDIQTMLAHFRTGDYTGGYNVYNAIGSAYDADFNSWLDACAAGACTAGGTPSGTPTAGFNAAVSGLTVRLTDRSTESGSGSITSWAWNFGDGTTAGTANPSKTYAAPGTYAISLTVTDSNGHTASTTVPVTVSGGGTPPCTNPDTRMMGQNCSRANQSASAGHLDYLYLYLPAGTTTLKVTTNGGTGNAYLYYNANAWATNTAYTASSTQAGNAQSITVTNSTAGYRYLSLYAHTAFSGVTVTTQY